MTVFIILGAGGNIGSQVVKSLSEADQPVLAVVHSAEKAKALEGGAVEAVVADVNDSAALRKVFQRGKRAFLLNPPGNVSADSNAAELATSKSITDALSDSGLEKIVVASTYGARPGDGIGDLTTLYDFEQRAKASGIPTAIDRGAYYFTNLAMLAEPASKGTLPATFAATMELPMVDPADLGVVAAERLQSALDDVGIVYVEGPERYTFGDVAAAFARHQGRDVVVKTTPREQLAESFKAIGFSEVSAEAYARMTEATIDETDLPKLPRRGRITLDAYIARLTRG
ncbi:NmrA family NAD(P)-binding protein [Devosia lacusdianchii]|uniref:NmrA family NAD(P)-binding protein n=1 Tax=Devosia lacusdianchii TaxID=2917991 RepID=UPI003B849A51